MTSIRRVHKVADLHTVAALAGGLFRAEEIPDFACSRSAWWLGRGQDGTPVAFAGARVLTHPNRGLGFLSLAGVLPSARGQGMQRRLIRVRIAWARALGLSGLVTYTSPDNVISANNLISCGFRLYRPQEPWGLASGIYLARRLT